MREIFLIAFAALLCACSPRQSPADLAAQGGELLIGNAADPATLDPTLITGLAEYKILTSLFEGLVSADSKTLEIEPAAAESWTFENDTYIFKIRKSAKWSDGEALRASDFVFAFRRALNPTLGAEYASFLYPIKNAKKIHQGELAPDSLGAEAIDEHTLKIKLENPCQHFLNLLYHSAYFPLPEHHLKKFDAVSKRDAIWMRPKNAVSNGAFTLQKWRINDSVRVVKSPTYWDAKNVKLNAIEFFPISNINTEDRAFRAGQLHLTDSIAPSRMNSIKQNASKNLHISDWLGTYYYIFNTARAPLNDMRVRKALAMAISRESIIENFLKAGQKPALSFVPEKSMKGYSNQVKIVEDVQVARELLAQAGYPNGKGFPQITLTYNTSEQHRPIAEAIQAMWKQNLNIEVELYNVSWPAYLDARKNLDFFIARSSWVADYASPESFLSNFQSQNGLNHSSWKSAKFDAFLQKAKTSNLQDAKKYFAEAENELIRDVVLMPIYFYSRVFLADARLKNWASNSLDYRNYKNVHFDNSKEEAK